MIGFFESERLAGIVDGLHLKKILGLHKSGRSLEEFKPTMSYLPI